MTRSQSLSLASDAPSEGLTPASRARPQSTRRGSRIKLTTEPPEALPPQPIFEEEPLAKLSAAPAHSAHAAAASEASPAASGHVGLAAQPTISYGSRLRSLLPRGGSASQSKRHVDDDEAVQECGLHEAETAHNVEGREAEAAPTTHPLYIALPAGLLLLLLGALFLRPGAPAPPTAAEMAAVRAELAALQSRFDSLEGTLAGSQQWQDFRHSYLASELAQQSREQTATAAAAAASFQDQQQQLEETRAWAAAAFQLLQVEVEAAAEQTQQHSRQQAKLLTAQLQAAHSGAALGERLPVPPQGALAAAAEVEMEDRWRLAVGSMLRSTLDTFAADRTGLADYALASAGGRVVGHSRLAGPLPLWYRAWRVLAAALAGPPPVLPHLDKLVLMPGAAPGQCLPLEGASGHVDIKLREAMLPAAITLQHIPASIAFDVRSAPRQLLVMGYESAPPIQKQGRGAGASVGASAGSGDSGRQLAELTYDLQGPPLQTFTLHSPAAISFVRVQVVSNHGHPAYTCLYRIRVHGSAAPASKGALMQSDAQKGSSLPQQQDEPPSYSGE